MAIHADLAVARRELDAAHAQHLGGGTAHHAAAAQQGAATAREFHEGEGLCEVVVGAAVEGDDLIELRVLRGEHHDGHRRGRLIGAQAAHDLETVGIGKHDVEEHGVGHTAGDGGLELAVAAETLCLDTLLAQGVQGQAPDVVIIFDVINHANDTSSTVSTILPTGRHR